MQRLMKMNPRDTVAVALRPIEAGEEIAFDALSVKAREAIPQGHKIALADLAAGSAVIKYGYPIGRAAADIAQGEWVHTHNLKTGLAGEETYEYRPDLHPVTYPKRNLTFDGYRRRNGKVGIRNDLYIVPTVGCVNGIAEQIIAEFKALHPDLGPFDNVTVLKHPYGCSQLGDDHRMTRSILLDAVSHPNAGGVLVFGLGCENNVVAEFRGLLGDIDESRVKFLVAQEVEDEAEAGLALLEELYEAAKHDRREPVPLSELNVGLKCGGSDGFSGITANPLLGAFSDFLISQGGSTVLTEVPEMFGAEHMLMARAANKDVLRKSSPSSMTSSSISCLTASRCTKIPPRATRPAASAPWRTNRSAARKRREPLRSSTCCSTAKSCAKKASACSRRRATIWSPARHSRPRTASSSCSQPGGERRLAALSRR
ncbi:hypothetical protein HMSSN036_74980 [Paenibacillus macerans]|nr:hypothetical protein HMSSN036_74980 [Paenibacillus macerans]